MRGHCEYNDDDVDFVPVENTSYPLINHLSVMNDKSKEPSPIVPILKSKSK